MSAAGDHVRSAKGYLDQADGLHLDRFSSPAEYEGERMALIAMAQVHATLATAPAEALEGSETPIWRRS